MNESTENASQKKGAGKTQLQMDMEKAASSAAKYFTEIMRATNTIVSNLRLEEIERTGGDDKFWRVTISFLDDGDGSTMQMLYGNRTRVYKIITVTDGDFVATSIKNRD